MAIRSRKRSSAPAPYEGIGTPVLIGSVADKAASATRTIASLVNVPAGTTIVVEIGARDPSDVAAPTVTDQAGNTYVPDFAPGAGVTESRWFRCSNCLALNIGQTITIGGMISGQSVVAHAVQIDRLDLANPLDATNSASGSSDAVASGNIATADQETIALGGICIAGTADGIEDPAFATVAAGKTTGGTVTDNRSVRLAWRRQGATVTTPYAATTGNGNTRFVSAISYKRAA